MTDIDYDKLVNIVRTIFLDQLCELGGFIVVNQSTGYFYRGRRSR